MRVIITGAAGMLGSDLRATAGLSGAEVIGADLHSCELELDITDAGSVLATWRRVRPDVVIHCAAYTNVDAAETHEHDAYRVNAVGAWCTAAACRDVGAAICYISTDFVFDGTKRTPYHEFDHPAPLNVYGASKLAGEQAVATHCSRHWIVRTAWLYGVAGRCFPATVLRRARAGEPLRVVADQTGSPTYTRDLAEAIWTLVSTAPYGVYHRTNSGEAAWADLAEQTLEYAGIDATVTRIGSGDWPSPVRRPAYSVLSSLSSAAAGLSPLRDWRDALRDFVTEHDAQHSDGR